MKIPTLISLFLLSALAIAPAADEKAEAAPKSKPRNPVLAPIEDVADLPRVLIIGDSISMGYTLPVREELEGIANVHRIPANGGPTSRGLANIDKWLGDGNWDVIHFNWGIHDLKYIGEERQVEPGPYEENLRALVAKLKATGAKLIWATITPIPEGKLNPDRSFGKVPEYNAIAAKVMEENDVATNDLFSYMMPRFEEFHKPQDLHYTSAGSAYLGKKVAQEIKAALGKE